MWWKVSPKRNRKAAALPTAEQIMLEQSFIYSIKIDKLPEKQPDVSRQVITMDKISLVAQTKISHNRWSFHTDIFYPGNNRNNVYVKWCAMWILTEKQNIMNITNI